MSLNKNNTCKMFLFLVKCCGCDGPNNSGLVGSNYAKSGFYGKSR